MWFCPTQEVICPAENSFAQQLNTNAWINLDFAQQPNANVQSKYDLAKHKMLIAQQKTVLPNS